ncbi:MAG TPA: GvpL/GvpF family gas vesicle protein [Vicinamibacterales bacterium]|nr:GvpL/GvpF family gas vesicle protein [Vicinamibacterales bacterium]
MTRGARVEWDVYAMTAAPVPAFVRVGRTPLRAYAVGPVAVLLASAAPAPAPLEDALRRQHDIIVALSNRFDPLLPVRFGTRMTLTRIVEATRASRDQVRNALDHVRGRQQMTVRLIEPAGAVSERHPATTGTAYLQRRRALHTVPVEAAPLMAALEAFVVDVRVVPGRAGIRASVYHLVERRAVAAYRRAAAAAIPGLAPWGATVTGPWPAFAFAPDLAR